MFFEEIEKKKALAQLSESTLYLIEKNLKNVHAYGFDSIEAADFYRLLSDEGRWFFAITFMEGHLDSMVKSPFINTNYDSNLPIVKSKFKESRYYT